VIKWCAYCQRYMGDVPPYDDFNLTHGICEGCAGGRQAGPEIAAAARLADFYGRLCRAGRSGEIPQASAVLDQGIQLGLGPVELLMGLMQPALYAVGAAWAAGATTVAREHGFTEMAASLVALVMHKYPEATALRRAQRPEVLLIAADGNFHTLGIQLVEVVLLLEGIPTFAVYPGISAEDVWELWREVPAPVVGFSVALPDHVSGVDAAVGLFLQNSQTPPRFVLGGFPVRSGVRPRQELPIEVMADPRDLVTALRRSP
jgi:methanogenic corrinoid protein MtbC1